MEKISFERSVCESADSKLKLRIWRKKENLGTNGLIWFLLLSLKYNLFCISFPNKLYISHYIKFSTPYLHALLSLPRALQHHALRGHWPQPPGGLLPLLRSHQWGEHGLLQLPSPRHLLQTWVHLILQVVLTLSLP